MSCLQNHLMNKGCQTESLGMAHPPAGLTTDGVTVSDHLTQSREANEKVVHTPNNIF